MPNAIKLATAASITATGAGAAVRLNKTPLLGGQGREGILRLDAAVGGSGSIDIEGHASTGATAPGAADAGWAKLVTLTSASPLSQELADLPCWIRHNVKTAGTGAVTITLEGVQ